jgi:hypothetical protein
MGGNTGTWALLRRTSVGGGQAPSTRHLAPWCSCVGVDRGFLASRWGVFGNSVESVGAAPARWCVWADGSCGGLRWAWARMWARMWAHKSRGAFSGGGGGALVGLLWATTNRPHRRGDDGMAGREGKDGVNERSHHRGCRIRSSLGLGDAHESSTRRPAKPRGFFDGKV